MSYPVEQRTVQLDSHTEAVDIVLKNDQEYRSWLMDLIDQLTNDYDDLEEIAAHLRNILVENTNCWYISNPLVRQFVKIGVESVDWQGLAQRWINRLAEERGRSSSST